MKPVKIYAIHYNRPDFIVWQHDTFTTHIKDTFEYIVVNNAKDTGLRKEINDTALNLGLKCIETHSDEELVGKHHADSFNHVWKNHAIKDHNCYVMMMDGDCFFIKDFNVNVFMEGSVMAGPYQCRNVKYHYLTPTIIISDIDQIPNADTIDWAGIGIDGIRLDSGGGLYLYLAQHPEIKARTKEIKSSWHIKHDNKNKHCLPEAISAEYNDEYSIEFFGNEILHYCRSSNWNYQTNEHHQLKSEFVKKFIYGIINNIFKAKDHNFQIVNSEYFGWNE